MTCFTFARTQFGGNAQSITRDRWVHHTSFLWDYDPSNMDYLTVSVGMTVMLPSFAPYRPWLWFASQIPKKRPEYRGDRSHNDFITRLSSHVKSVDAFEAEIYAELSTRYQMVGDVRGDEEYAQFRAEMDKCKGTFQPRSIIEQL